MSRRATNAQLDQQISDLRDVLWYFRDFQSGQRPEGAEARARIEAGPYAEAAKQIAAVHGPHDAEAGSFGIMAAGLNGMTWYGRVQGALNALLWAREVYESGAPGIDLDEEQDT